VVGAVWVVGRMGLGSAVRWQMAGRRQTRKPKLAISAFMPGKEEGAEGDCAGNLGGDGAVAGELAGAPGL
jgi:hypothetical protein